MNKVSEKGKYFTERVSKKAVEVAVVTVHGHARGHVYVLPNQRVKDLLNNPGELFLALTDAVITPAEGPAEEVPFVALNKQHIVSVVPIDEDKVQHEPDEDGFYPY